MELEESDTALAVVAADVVQPRTDGKDFARQ
jgi:hypothetical protein